MAGKIESIDDNGNTVTHYITGNTVKGYVFKDGKMHRKPGYEEKDNNVVTPKQESRKSIFYTLQLLINKLLNK